MFFNAADFALPVFSLQTFSTAIKIASKFLPKRN
jgi:hypothetical protein